MENLPVNVVDLVVAAVLLISALLAFSRGLVREVLAIAAWIAAIAAAIYGYQPLTPYVQKYIADPTLAAGAAAGALFLVTLVICAVLSHQISRGVRRSGAVGAVDRSLGLLFGLARGGLLVSLAYMLFAWVVAEKDRPAWVTEARTLPLAARGADFIRQAIPAGMLRQGEEAVGAAKSKVNEAIGTGEAFDSLNSPPPTEAPGQPADSAGSPGSSGYNDAERNAMDQLNQTSQ